MVINHNMSAMFANRQLGVTGTSLEKDMAKLSSGMRIIILTVIISVAAAVLHPIKDDSNEEKEAD